MRLRLTTACPQCRRQYSVADRMVGKKFHCHCGEAITVERPSGYDAAIIACSSCGAPRENSRPACGHCGSDFTLREQDLDTVCPGCVARISNKSKFCHHCGLRIHPETLRKRSSPHVCPVCEGDKHLAHRTIGAQAFSVQECQLCAGLWMPVDRLETLLVDKSFDMQSAGRLKSDEFLAQAGRMYRPCVVCRELMVRQNLGRGKSRVIVDVCGHHGVWFDNDELARLLSWVRVGGIQEVLLDLSKFKSSTNRDLGKLAHQMDEPVQKSKSHAVEAYMEGMCGRRNRQIVEGLFRMFGW